MLNISDTQLQILADPYRAAFVARVRRFVEKKLPQRLDESGSALELQIGASLDEATALGVATEQEQVLYVVLAMLHGPAFTEREPWAIETVARHRAAGYQSGLAQALMEATASAAAAGS